MQNSRSFKPFLSKIKNTVKLWMIISFTITKVTTLIDFVSKDLSLMFDSKQVTLFLLGLKQFFIDI